MQHLFTQWSKLSQKLKDSRVCIFLDYDGTLTPIAKTPQRALLAKEMQNLLKKIAQSPRCTLVIISGRALSNLKKMVGIKNVIYVGNHGLEFGDWDTAFKAPISVDHKKILLQIKNELRQQLGAIKGVLLESKQLALCLHYRLAHQQDIPAIKTIFNRVVAAHQTQLGLQVLTGKKVLEVAPAILWNKGTIVSLVLVMLQSIFKHKRILPLYVGDDLTDENAFDVLKKRGITVLVGEPKQTQANYYLKNIQEVKILLKEIIGIKKAAK